MISNGFRAVFFASLISVALSLSCLEVKKRHEKTCLETESHNYVHCVRTRMKRQQDNCQYDDDCYECNCDTCSYSSCGGQCDSCCNSCCMNYVQCHTSHCCHRQCHSECRTFDCRSDCRQSCYESVKREKEKEIVYVPAPGSPSYAGSSGSAASQTSSINNNNPNITTIINIKSIINNTQQLDIPINMSYVNKNNITLQEESNCCVVIGPKQCIPAQGSSGNKCYHTRSKQCGSYCTANIVHQENRKVCNSVDGYGRPTNCQQQTTYIPQPQPKCVYTSTWPYVSCGIQPPVECQGCYGHYLNSGIKDFNSCPTQCYDNFRVGPLYRQGPFYQTGFPSAPPCMNSPQGCMGSPMGSMGNFGGYWPGSMGGFGGGYGMGLGYNPMMGPPNVYGQTWSSNLQPLNGTNQEAISPTLPGNITVLVNEDGYQGDMPFVTLVEGEKEIEIDVAVIPAKSVKPKRSLTKKECDT